MNVEDLLQHHTNLVVQAYAVMAKKNHDYAGAEGDTPFRNFTRIENFGVCSTERGILVRMIDKMSRLSTYLEGSEFQVSDETFDDTIIDLINYCVILSGYCKQEREEV